MGVSYTGRRSFLERGKSALVRCESLFLSRERAWSVLPSEAASTKGRSRLLHLDEGGIALDKPWLPMLGRAPDGGGMALHKTWLSTQAGHTRQRLQQTAAGIERLVRKAWPSLMFSRARSWRSTYCARTAGASAGFARLVPRWRARCVGPRFHPRRPRCGRGEASFASMGRPVDSADGACVPA